jgi:hypothetical protein
MSSARSINLKARKIKKFVLRFAQALAFQIELPLPSYTDREQRRNFSCDKIAHEAKKRA